MKKLSKISILLFVLTLGFVSCNDDEKVSIYSIYEEPAVLESVGEFPVIRTAYGKYSVPDLANTSIAKGALLWVAFTFDTDNPSSKDMYTAQNFRYVAIDSAKVSVPVDAAEFENYLADSYVDSIDVALLYNTYIDKMLFFKFTQTAADDQVYDYELVCDPESKDSGNIPTLYIRSKKVADASATTASSSKKNTVFGFQMDEYTAYYRENISNSGPVKFNLKYKTGTNKEGKDVYRAFKSNPISWGVK